jgi:hypothetical protein
MRFDEHPTWRMLEEGKNYFRFLVETSPDVEIVLTAEAAVHSLHRLQLQVENNLIEKFGGPEDY